jgi:hypothetical protein
MKLKDKGSLVVYNVPQEVGQKLVAAGLAVEVVAASAPELAYAEILWQVRDGAKVEDFLYPPEIFAKCSRCGNPTWQSSQKGTAHQTMQYRHCGGRVEEVPEHIAQEYTKRWAAYISLSKKKKVVLPALTSREIDRARDALVMKDAGYKTREELILEARLSVPARKG